MTNQRELRADPAGTLYFLNRQISPAANRYVRSLTPGGQKRCTDRWVAVTDERVGGRNASERAQLPQPFFSSFVRLLCWENVVYAHTRSPKNRLEHGLSGGITKKRRGVSDAGAPRPLGKNVTSCPASLCRGFAKLVGSQRWVIANSHAWWLLEQSQVGALSAEKR
jgi:hypothetical protein